MPIKKFLLYITNNEDKPRDEAAFDMVFFIVNTAALIIGGAYLAHIRSWEWIPFLIIEYTWAIDTMRHNRP